VYCGRDLLASKLRPANIDASAGAVEEIAHIVAQIRQALVAHADGSCAPILALPATA